MTNKPANYDWDEAAAGRAPQTDQSIKVMRRRRSG